MIHDKNYQSKALRLYPATEVIPQVAQNGALRKIVRLKGKDAEYSNGDGLPRPVMKQIMQIVSKMNDTASLSGVARIRNLFLVTESLLDAKIAACILGGLHIRAARCCGNGEDEEDCEDDDYFEDDACFDDEQGTLYITYPAYFDMSSAEPKEGEGANYLQFGAIAAAMEGVDCSLFGGLSDEKQLEKQIEMIRLCPGELRIIIVPRKLVKAPAIMELVELDPDHNCLLELDNVDFEYYVQVCKALLEGEGASFKDEGELRETLLRMMRCAGDNFSEEWIGRFLDKGLDGQKFDFQKMFGNEESKTAMQRLSELPGLKNLKQVLREHSALVREESRNPRLKMHRNMIFAGNPGDGKTMGAELAADILAGSGATRPKFIVATRSDLVGKYVGQTAPRVKAAFERARGGVLFVDEAGFFLNRQSGGFVNEAIKEFVRYMELYPDVTVIFAMYSSEVSDFLELDVGIRSRVSRIVKFEDYSVQELIDIADYMFRESGYKRVGGEKALKEYFETERKKEGFGNARAVRKLVESVILSVSLARITKEGEGKTEAKCQMDEDSMDISEYLIKQGIRRLKSETLKGKGSMGFLAASCASSKPFEMGDVQEGFA